jgi:hypothetical protein
MSWSDTLEFQYAIAMKEVMEEMRMMAITVLVMVR